MEVVTRVRRAVLAPHGRTRTLGFPGCELVGAHVSGEADSHGGDVRSETRIQQSGSTAAADACGGGAVVVVENLRLPRSYRHFSVRGARTLRPLLSLTGLSEHPLSR